MFVQGQKQIQSQISSHSFSTSTCTGRVLYICHLPAVTQTWPKLAKHTLTLSHPPLRQRRYLPACPVESPSSLQSCSLACLALFVALILWFILTNQKLSTYQTETTIYKLLSSPLGNFWWSFLLGFVHHKCVKLLPISNVNCYFPLQTRSQWHRYMAHKTTSPSVK